MQFVKYIVILLTVSAFSFLVACEKSGDNTPSPVPNKDSIQLPVMVKAFRLLSDTIGGKEQFSVDTLKYVNGRLDKVVHNILGLDFTTYSFGYTNDGKIASITVDGSAHNQDYYIHYVGNRIDSMTIVDSIHEPFTIGSKMTYNAQSKLTGVVTDRWYNGKLLGLYHWTYSRDSSGRLDTLQGVYTDVDIYRYIRPSATVSPVNKAMKNVSDAYIFLRAIFVYQHIFRPASLNLYIHHLLNKEDNVFNDGLIDEYGTPHNNNIPYSNQAVMNGDGTLRAYEYIEAKTEDPWSGASEGLIFTYKKFPKQ